MANANRAVEIVKGLEHPDDLSNAQKTEVLRLVNEAAQKAHLSFEFIDVDGSPINILEDYKNISNIQVKIMDLEGNQLAVMDPSMADFTPEAIEAKVTALKQAVEAKVELDKDGVFNLMPETELPATNLPTGIALGSLIAALGVVALFPAVKADRKLDA